MTRPRSLIAIAALSLSMAGAGVGTTGAAAATLPATPQTITINGAQFTIDPLVRGSSATWTASGECITDNPTAPCVVVANGVASLDLLCTQLTVVGSGYFNDNSGNTPTTFTTTLAPPPLLNSSEATWTGVISGTATPPGSAGPQSMTGALSISFDEGNTDPLHLIQGSYDGLCPWTSGPFAGHVYGEVTIG